MYDFADKVALVTGATRGIGLALVKALAAEGARVSLLARDGTKAHEEAFRLKRRYGVEAIGRECDIRHSNRVREVVEDTVRHLGRIDLVFNNAGDLGALGPLYQYDPATWANVIDTNLNGSFYVARFAAARMAQTGGGRLVFMSSSVGRQIRENWGPYCISKYAVEGLSKLFAAESAQTEVVACTINPGGTATEMRREAFPQEDQARLPTPDAVAQACLKILRQPDRELNGHAFEARDHL